MGFLHARMPEEKALCAFRGWHGEAVTGVEGTPESSGRGLMDGKNPMSA